jgi:hypothetical protein
MVDWTPKADSQRQRSAYSQRHGCLPWPPGFTAPGRSISHDGQFELVQSRLCGFTRREAPVHGRPSSHEASFRMSPRPGHKRLHYQDNLKAPQRRQTPELGKAPLFRRSRPRLIGSGTAHAQTRPACCRSTKTNHHRRGPLTLTWRGAAAQQQRFGRPGRGLMGH